MINLFSKKRHMSVDDVLEINPAFADKVLAAEGDVVNLDDEAAALTKEAETKMRAARLKKERADRLFKATKAYREATK